MPSAPLRGVTVIELGGIGPGPFAGMFLGELGADVIRVDRPDGQSPFPGSPRDDLLNRGKRSITLDLKDPSGVGRVLELLDKADVLIEGFRPGVAERLGLGPDVCLVRNRRLVYGRMTGWGQDGPYSGQAGHDLTYIATTGVLHAIGEPAGPPVPPLNLIGDYGGGGMYLVVGVLAALREVALTGRGQVVDAAIVDGVTHLMMGTYALMAAGSWTDQRGHNELDGAAPYYGVYRAADGEYVAVAAAEPRFFATLIRHLGVDFDLDLQQDRDCWPQLRELLAAAFARHPQRVWIERFAGTDACVAPVWSIEQAAEDPQLRARGSLVRVNGVLQAAPAPRFSVSALTQPGPPPELGQHNQEVLGSQVLRAVTDVTRDRAS